MERLQAYRYELKTNGLQARLLGQAAGCCRSVWNRALRLRKDYYEELGLSISCSQLQALLPYWKEEKDWLGEAPSQSLQASLKNLDLAYKRFFKGLSDFPDFKRKGGRDSAHFPQGFKLDEGSRRVFLPKIGWVGYHQSRKVEGVVRSMTVSREGNKWFVSILIRRELAVPVRSSDSIVGIDLGCAVFAALSDDTTYAPASPLAKSLKKIKKASRRLSRKVKFSRNWTKAKRRLAREHLKVSRRRKDFLHKTSTEICKNHAVIVIEDLRVKNMSRSAKGTIEFPGVNVAQKSGLNRTILDQGWGEFRRQLKYKSAWFGGKVVVVDPRNTSRTCLNDACGHVSKENRKTQAKFECVECGESANADIHAAKVILAAGLVVIACGELSLDGSMKQEPLEKGSVAA